MSDTPATSTDRHETASYEIRVSGHLDPRWAARLGVRELRHDNDGTTALRGISADQAALHGLLQRLRDLGLTLVSATRIDSHPSPNSRNPK